MELEELYRYTFDAEFICPTYITNTLNVTSKLGVVKAVLGKVPKIEFLPNIINVLKSKDISGVASFSGALSGLITLNVSPLVIVGIAGVLASSEISKVYKKGEQEEFLKKIEQKLIVINTLYLYSIEINNIKSKLGKEFVANLDVDNLVDEVSKKHMRDICYPNTLNLVSEIIKFTVSMSLMPKSMESGVSKVLGFCGVGLSDAATQYNGLSSVIKASVLGWLSYGSIKKIQESANNYQTLHDKAYDLAYKKAVINILSPDLTLETDSQSTLASELRKKKAELQKLREYSSVVKEKTKHRRANAGRVRTSQQSRSM